MITQVKNHTKSQRGIIDQTPKPCTTTYQTTWNNFDHHCLPI